MAPRIGFIGMGLMGQAMSKNLVLKAGLEEPLLLYSRTRSRAEEHCLIIGHSVVAASLHELVDRSDIIWSCVQDDQAVIETLNECLMRDVTGKLFLDSSTIPPDVTNRIAKQVVEKNAEFVAMPVFGDPSLASVGKLICVPAGPVSSVSRILPYLTGVIAQAVVDLSGEEAGKASLLKLIGNVLVMETMEMIAEVHVLAEKTGLGTASAQKLIDAFPKAASTIYSQKMVGGDYYRKEPMVEISKARHLTSQVLDLARVSGATLKSYQVAIEHLAVAESNAGPTGDITGIYGAVRMESQLPYENQGSPGVEMD